nr:reverse transcriptase domain-containing protein [Tanacetum cinerariifolium]
MYGAEAVIPVEIGMPTLRTMKVDMIKNDEALGVNLKLLEEKREQAVIQEAKSKAKMDKCYNARVRNTSFRSEDLVDRNNEASHSKDGGKLEPKWEGQYEVTKALRKRAYLETTTKIPFHEHGTLTISREEDREVSAMTTLSFGPWIGSMSCSGEGYMSSTLGISAKAPSKQRESIRSTMIKSFFDSNSESKEKSTTKSHQHISLLQKDHKPQQRTDLS